MPIAGDSFITTLKKPHLKWGSHRHTSTRGPIHGEAYLQIPKEIAKRYNIYNSSKNGAIILYNCSTSDGYIFDATLKACGNTIAGDIYAKQFQGYENLKLLGDWYNHIGAKEGDRIEIYWSSPTDITLTKV